MWWGVCVLALPSYYIDKYSLLMHRIEIKSSANFLWNEQNVFAGGSITFQSVLLWRYYNDKTHTGYWRYCHSRCRPLAAMDAVKPKSEVPRSGTIKESQSPTGRQSQVQADTSCVDWSEMSVGKCRISQSIADVNDVIFILFWKRLKTNAQSSSLVYTCLSKVNILAWKKNVVVLHLCW